MDEIYARNLARILKDKCRRCMKCIRFEFNEIRNNGSI